MTKVLVIDDDRDMCLLLKKFLERNNYEVIDFTSGKKALAWYEENTPDIVLCDLRLEDISGLEVLQKMKATNPALPFLIITGYSDVRSAVERLVKAKELSTLELDRICHEACIERDSYPSPLNYGNFPRSICTSVNEVICHGIPDMRPLKVTLLLSILNNRMAI